jgi:hypothetical protein
MMQPYRIKQWSFVRRFSRSKGGVRDYLTGEVYADPGYPDGTRIVTTAIVSQHDREVITASGAHYLLEGEPERDCTETTTDPRQGMG